MSRIVVWTLPWKFDQEADLTAGEEPNTLVRCRVFVDDVEIKDATAIEVGASGDFATATIHVTPSTIDFVPVPSAKFYDDNEGPRSTPVARNGKDEMIAAVKL